MSSQQKLQNKTPGRWTKQEHENFLLGLQMYGKNWKKIEELIGTRNGSQIRSHAQKFFLKFKKQCPESLSLQNNENLEKDSEVVNSKQLSGPENKYSDHSYFLGKIVQYSTNRPEQFDLWATMIDQQGYRAESTTEEPVKRKDSFVDFDEESAQIKALSSPGKKVKV